MPLDAKNTKHSVQNALALAQASQLIYADEAAVKAGLKAIIGQPLQEFKFLNVAPTNTEAVMAGFDDAIVLCFRGSASKQDWLRDGNIRLVPFHKGGLIHLGFRDAVDSVIAEIQSTLDAWSGKGRTLWISGHSLGGALAMLTAAYLRFPADPTKTLPRPLAGLYTFGQPRVGTTEFCNACSIDFNSTYFRYINHQDIVTRIPPRELGYWHCGRDEYIGPDGKIHEDPSWWQVFIDRVQAGAAMLQKMQLGQVQIPAITEHFMANYIARIEKNLP